MNAITALRGSRCTSPPSRSMSLVPARAGHHPGPDRLRNWPASESFCDAWHDK
jgi:hypothetical protein